MSLYRGLTALVEPLAPLLLGVGAREEAPLRAERLGRAGLEPVDVWWHAASLGEVEALTPIYALWRTGSDAPAVVTTSTATGRARAAERFDAAVHLAPLDLPRLVGRVLAARRPRSLVLTETEIWPNLLGAAADGGIRVGVVNGRISDRSWPRYRRFRGAVAPAFATLAAVAARSEVDAERFAALGVPPEAVRVTGNSKADTVGEAPPPLALPWGEAPVLVAASVHPGEETAVWNLFEVARRANPAARLVVAPRHLDRADVWLRFLGARARVAVRSRPSAGDADAEVLVLDTHGELRAALSAARGAFLGGTVVPVGGHSPLEAAAAGVPQVAGPHVANVREEVEVLLRTGALATGDRGRQGTYLQNVFADDTIARGARNATRAALDAMRGASARSLAWLRERGVRL